MNARIRSRNLEPSNQLNHCELALMSPQLFIIEIQKICWARKSEPSYTSRHSKLELFDYKQFRNWLLGTSTQSQLVLSKPKQSNRFSNLRSQPWFPYGCSWPSKAKPDSHQTLVFLTAITFSCPYTTSDDGSENSGNFEVCLRDLELSQSIALN